MRGSFTTALSIFETAEKLCLALQHKDPFLPCNLYRVYGSIYRNSTSNEKGHACFLKALDICKAGPDGQEKEKTQAEIFSCLGNTALALERVPESLDFHRKGISIRENNTASMALPKGRRGWALAMLNSGWAYWKNSDLERAEEVLRQAMEVFEQLASADGKHLLRYYTWIRFLLMNAD